MDQDILREARGLAKASSFASQLEPVAIEDGVAVLHASDELQLLISRIAHVERKKCGGFVAHRSLEEAVGILAKQGIEAASGLAVDYSLGNQQEVEQVLNRLSPTNIESTISSLSSFKNRYYTSPEGVQAALWIRDTWSDLVRNRSDVTVSTFPHQGFSQNSVILSIEGSARPDEVVVLGGHLDSIAFPADDDVIAPGADDDASGIANLTEILRALVSNGFQPKRTVQFMGYAGEEKGLLGSQDIAATYKADGVDVVGVLQLDMTAFKGSAQDIALITRDTSPAQNDFLVDLINEYLPEVNWMNTGCHHGCSDHYSWTANGYPASFPFESAYSDYNPAIHTRNDTLDRLSMDHSLNFAKLGAAFAVEMGKPSGDGGTSDGQLTFVSIANEDGFVRELRESSDTGGSSLASSSKKAAVRVGDHKSDRQFKGFLSFDTSELPDNVTILSATLKLKRGTLKGNPFATLGTLQVDIRRGGFSGDESLQNKDFQAAATAVGVATVPSSGSPSVELSSAGRNAIHTSGTTQIRLRFTTDDDDDGANDFVGYFSGEAGNPANRPKLVVTYE